MRQGTNALSFGEERSRTAARRGLGGKKAVTRDEFKGPSSFKSPPPRVGEGFEMAFHLNSAKPLGRGTSIRWKAPLLRAPSSSRASSPRVEARLAESP